MYRVAASNAGDVGHNGGDNEASAIVVRTAIFLVSRHGKNSLNEAEIAEVVIQGFDPCEPEIVELRSGSVKR